MGSQALWMIDEIEVDVTGLFTTHHYLQTEVGTLGELTFPAFSHQGIYRAADGHELLMQKTRWFGSAHELVDGEMVRGTADRPRLLSRDIVIHLDGHEYLLEPEGLFRRGWYLKDAEHQTLLEIQPRGVFRQGAYLTLTGMVDADLVIFAYYLVHMRQQEEAAAGAAAAGGGAS
jgi:hypothetical protein